MDNNIYNKLKNIQQELKAPKNQYNNHGGYKYRNCEDVLEAIKPLLGKNNLVLLMSDDICTISDRVYVKATCTLIEIATGLKIEVSAMAREGQDMKGINPMQLTGSTSSYARKYALNGLFLIDDSKDDDFNNNGKNQPEKNTVKPNTNTNTNNDDNEKLRTLKNLLYLVDKNNMEQNLAELTSFNDKEGKLIKGLTDFEKLKGQRLSIALTKACKIYDEHYKILQKKSKK